MVLLGCSKFHHLSCMHISKNLHVCIPAVIKKVSIVRKSTYIGKHVEKSRARQHFGTSDSMVMGSMKFVDELSARRFGFRIRKLFFRIHLLRRRISLPFPCDTLSSSRIPVFVPGIDTSTYSRFKIQFRHTLPPVKCDNFRAGSHPRLSFRKKDIRMGLFRKKSAPSFGKRSWNIYEKLC